MAQLQMGTYRHPAPQWQKLWSQRSCAVELILPSLARLCCSSRQPLALAVPQGQCDLGCKGHIFHPLLLHRCFLLGPDVPQTKGEAQVIPSTFQECCLEQAFS